jgi:hypothetical protein
MRMRQLSTMAREDGGANEAVREAMPFVTAATIAGLLILGLALVPAYVVPWYRMSMVLEDHRGQLAVVGGMPLLAAAVVLVLTFRGQ